MADPRGHGFKRGTGPWHAPTREVTEVNPVELGWTPTVDGGYELNGVTLKPHGLGWLYTQVVNTTIGGIERKGKISQYVGNGLLPRLTQEFMRDDIHLREIAAATRATYYRIVINGIELFRKCPSGWEVGRKNGNNIEWRGWPNAYLPENVERI